MITSRILLHASLASTLALLGACGGGGDGDTAQPPAPVPVAGSYGWVLKAEGPTDNLKYGLSLIHPSLTGTEFVIETASAAVTDAKLVATGTVNAGSMSVSGLTPYALVYIVGGDVRRVPLVANGVAPKSLVKRAASTSACRFLIDAVDHASPEQSRFLVSTAGADGACETADDARGEVQLGGASGIAFTPIVGAAPLAALRDPATLAPRGWVLPTEVALWSPAPGSTFAIRPAGNPIVRVVSSTYRSALVESASGLSLLDFPGASSVVDSVVTGPVPTSWQLIGYDSQFHYLYRNSSDETGTWQVLRVSHSAPAAGLLNSGSGAVAVASLGKDQIYLTVFTPTSNQLLRLTKAVPGAAVQVLENTASTTLSTIVTSASDVHQLWRVTGVGTPAPGYLLEMIDEAGTRLFTSTGGGFPMLLAESSALNFNASESRTRFVFADRYGARAYGDAVLTSYDAAARTVATVGTLPGTADFGNDFVFANVSAGPSSFMTGFAARSSNGVVQSGGTRVFSFEAGAASSLKYTNQQQ